MGMNHALVAALRSKGRGGDTDVVHVNEHEKAVLSALGGAGTTNPHTGLKEYRILGDVGKFMGLGGKSGHWSRILNPLAQTKDFTGAPFSQKVLPVAAGIVGGMFGGPLGAGAASAAAGAATSAAAEKPGNEIANSALISGIGGLAGGSLGSFFGGAGEGAFNAAGEGTAGVAEQATVQGLTQSAEQIGSQLGGNAAGTSLAQGAETLGSQGLAQGFTETAAKEAAAEAARQAIYKKLLVTALKQGGKALTHQNQVPNYLPPDMPVATPANVRQTPFMSGPGSQYNRLVYGY